MRPVVLQPQGQQPQVSLPTISPFGPTIAVSQYPAGMGPQTTHPMRFPPPHLLTPLLPRPTPSNYMVQPPLPLQLIDLTPAPASYYNAVTCTGTIPRYSQQPPPAENYQSTGYGQQVYTTAAMGTTGGLNYSAQVPISVLESTRNSSFIPISSNTPGGDGRGNYSTDQDAIPGLHQVFKKVIKPINLLADPAKRDLNRSRQRMARHLDEVTPRFVRTNLQHDLQGMAGEIQGNIEENFRYLQEEMLNEIQQAREDRLRSQQKLQEAERLLERVARLEENERLSSRVSTEKKDQVICNRD